VNDLEIDEVFWIGIELVTPLDEEGFPPADETELVLSLEDALETACKLPVLTPDSTVDWLELV